MNNHHTPELEHALQLAADRQASDLYLVPGEPLSLRIDGAIERTEGDALSAQQVRQTAVAAVGDARLAELGADRACVVTSCGLTGIINGTMAVTRTRGDLSIAVHILPQRIPSVKEIGLPPAVVEAAGAAGGLVLFSGLTGSGKTTSMLSLVDHINARQARHICTVEDPIEVHIAPKRSLVQQREVGTDVPDMASGIVAALQHTADVILVGEMRSPDDVEACVRVALLGRLVITQAHALTPQGAIRRLVECQAPDKASAFRRHISQALRAVVAQVLLPRPDAKTRTAAYGVLIPDDTMRAAIAEGRDPLDPAGPLPQGCQSLIDDIERLRSQGTVDDRAAGDAINLVCSRS